MSTNRYRPVVYMALAVVILSSADGRTQPPGGRVDLLGDPLPAGALARFSTQRLQHVGISRAEFSPDGKLLLSISPGDNTVRLWEVATGKQLARTPVLVRQIEIPSGVSYNTTDLLRDDIPPPAPGMANAIFGPDEQVYIVNSVSGVTHWHFRSGARIESHDTNQLKGTAGALSPNGKLLAIGGVDGAVSLATAPEWKKVKLKNGKDDRVNRMAFSPDGALLAVAYDRGEVQLWDVKKKSLLHTWPFAEDEWFNVSLLFAPDSRSLIVTVAGTMDRFDTATGKKADGFASPPEKVAAIHFNADGTLIGLGVDGRVHRWNDRSEKTLSTVGEAYFTNPNEYWTFGTIRADGSLAALVRMDNIYLIDTRTGRMMHESIAHRAFPIQVAFSDNGGAVCLGDDWALRTWDLATGKLGRTMRIRALPSDSPLGSTMSADGQWLAVLDGSAARVRVRSINSEKDAWTFEFGEEDYPEKMTLSPDGRYLAMIQNQELIAWNVGTGKKHATVPTDERGVAFVRWSPDGRMLAVAGEKELVLWEVATTGRRRKWEVAIPSAAALSADGRRVVVGSADGTVRVFAMDADRPEVEVMAGLQIVNAVAMSPDGKLFAAASADVIRVWDVEGRPWAVFRGHDGSIKDLAVTPDGRALVSASVDRTALVWDLTRPANRKPSLAEADWQQCWLDLGSPDAAVAFAAMQALKEKPAAAVVLLKLRLRPAMAPPRAQVERWIADLGSPGFATRRQAARTLERLDSLAENAIRAAVEKATGSEVQAALRRLVERLDAVPRHPDRLREVRGVEVLEAINTPEARALLESLAAGDDSRQTREAKDALKRRK